MQKTGTQLQQLLAGTQKDIPATAMVAVDGVQMKQSDIVAKLQGYIQLFEQADAAKAAFGQSTKPLQDARSEISQFMLVYAQALRQFLGRSSPLLGDFGIAVSQRKVPSVETLTLAKAKRQQTRDARKTMGNRQKQQVKGSGVAAVTVGADTSTDVQLIPPPNGSVAGSAGTSTAAPVAGVAPPGGSPGSEK